MLAPLMGTDPRRHRSVHHLRTYGTGNNSHGMEREIMRGRGREEGRKDEMVSKGIRKEKLETGKTVCWR